MHYVYILRSQKDGNLYVGYTKDLAQRVREHNAGRVPSTRLRQPLDLIHYEAFVNQIDATSREKWYKSGWGRAHVKQMLASTLENFGGLDQKPSKISN